MSDIEFRGMDEFIGKLSQVANEYADTTEKHLRKVGNKLKKDAKEKSPDSGVNHKHKIKDEWHSKVEGLQGKDLEYQLRNSAPHYHLVERGHVQKTKSGKIVGFTQGKHFFQQTVNDFQNSGEVEKEMEKFMKDVKKKLD
jgi:HK97 gp10 family phage protein